MLKYEDNGDMVEELMKKIEEITSNIIKTNIMVVGKTGVGKSTLINSVFRSNIAETGVGKPVTQHLRKIEREDVPVVLYDTKGLELKEGVQLQVKEEIIDVINNSRKGADAGEYIHAIWYCINAQSSRIEETEEELIRILSEEVQVPIIIVMTQCPSDDEDAEKFIKEIQDMNLDVVNVIPVMAQPKIKKSTGEIKEAPYGLNSLVEVTYRVLPDSVQKGFINAQKVNIKAKEKKARKYVNAYLATTFATGFSPIPGSDAPVLITQQVTMLAHITSIFGLPMDKAVLTTIVSSVFGSGSATLAGKFIVSNILKLVPGWGTILGGLICGTTATILTASLAKAYIALMVKMCEMEGKESVMLNQQMLNELGEMFEKEVAAGTKSL